MITRHCNDDGDPRVGAHARRGSHWAPPVSMGCSMKFTDEQKQHIDDLIRRRLNRERARHLRELRLALEEVSRLQRALARQTREASPDPQQ